MNLKDLELVTALDQNFYDSFNTFMLSSDLKVFGKLLARIQLLIESKIYLEILLSVECLKELVFLLFKIKRYFCPNSYKKVIGFDFLILKI